MVRWISRSGQSVWRLSTPINVIRIHAASDGTSAMPTGVITVRYSLRAIITGSNPIANESRVTSVRP